MKHLIIAALVLLNCSPAFAVRRHYVRGHFRSDGTWVDGYWRGDGVGATCTGTTYPDSCVPRPSCVGQRWRYYQQRPLLVGHMRVPWRQLPPLHTAQRAAARAMNWQRSSWRAQAAWSASRTKLYAHYRYLQKLALQELKRQQAERQRARTEREPE